MTNYFELIHNELDRSSDHSTRENINIIRSSRKQRIQASYVEYPKDGPCRSSRRPRPVSTNTTIVSSRDEPVYNERVKKPSFCVDPSTRNDSSTRKRTKGQRGNNSDHSRLSDASPVRCMRSGVHPVDDEIGDCDNWSTSVLFHFERFHSRRKRFPSIPNEVACDGLQEDKRPTPMQKSGSGRRVMMRVATSEQRSNKRIGG